MGPNTCLFMFSNILKETSMSSLMNRKLACQLWSYSGLNLIMQLHMSTLLLLPGKIL